MSGLDWAVFSSTVVAAVLCAWLPRTVGFAWPMFTRTSHHFVWRAGGVSFMRAEQLGLERDDSGVSLAWVVEVSKGRSLPAGSRIALLSAAGALEFVVDEHGRARGDFVGRDRWRLPPNLARQLLTE